jgi:phosphate starvation-inducible protein PhoH and related proteins
MPERFVPVEDADEQRLLFGSLDRNVRALRERFGVVLSARRGAVRIVGDDEESVREVARRVGVALARTRDGDDPPGDAEMYTLLLDDDPREPERERDRERDRDRGGDASDGRRGDGPRRTGRLAPAPRSTPEVRPLTARQARYVDAIRGHDVVIAVGPAGTGKTYLAVSEAVASLREGRHKKLILTRPAVEAGERLGYLPGDFQAKINPYLRPLYDALEEMLRFGELQRSIHNDVIEILPLAYMRGRTLKHAFIILDEAQNTTPAQMKMFLTRMGEGSKIVVTGDVTQVDLPEGVTSGLVEAATVLRSVEGLSVVEFDGRDIIRHPMVQRIVDAYDRHSGADASPRGDRPPPAAPPPAS